jgi:nitrous oxidase accessory protein NosD
MLRAGTGSRGWRRLIGAAVVLPLGVVGLTLASAPSALAVTSRCLIINNAINTSYTSLQDAVNAASPGATLWVRGTCTGTTTVSKDLTITGQQPNGFTAPILNGNQGGVVLSIDSATVTVNTLTITGGVASLRDSALAR